MAMTQEQVEAAAKWLREGLTYAQIGARLGLTRNTVIGKMARVGLAHLNKNSASGARRPRPRAPSLPTLAKARQVEAPPPPARARAAPAKTARIEPPVVAESPPPPPPLAPARMAAPLRGRVTLMELGTDSCRYGHGDPRAADFRFCGERAARGPFCGYHAQLCYEPKGAKR